MCCAVMIALPSTGLAEDATIRLAGVPEHLSFPLPAGQNAILAARVEGARPQEVWLARGGQPRARYILRRSGQGAVYQVNLAAPGVRAVLSAEEGAGQFRVFARLPGGEVISSVPVSFEVAEGPREPPTLYVQVDGERRKLHGWPSAEALQGPALEAEVEGQSVRVRMDGVRWLESLGQMSIERWMSPEGVQRLEVEFDERVGRPSAEAWAGEKAWKGEPTEAGGLLAIEVTKQVRRAWRDAGLLTLVCRHGRRVVARAVLRAPPRELDLPEGAGRLTLIQRRGKDLPGSKGFLRLRIGDITAGRVLVSVSSMTGERLVDQQPLRQGQELGFSLGERTYTLALKKLVNVLVGDDYAIFEVTEKVPATDRPAGWAKPMQVEGVPNLHKVSDDLYRSAQPTEEGMKNLKGMGIKKIVNLRSPHSDRDEIGSTGLHLKRIPMEAWDPDEEEAVRFLRIVGDPERTPVLVHCQHGADRTGAMCALHRVAMQGWTKEEAIREMKQGGYGFHGIWENLARWIEERDIGRIKAKKNP